MRVSIEQVIVAIKQAESKQEVCRLLGWPENGRYALKVMEIAQKTNTSINHFRVGSKKKFEVIKKVCPVCGSSFTTKKGHKKEKTTCSCSCANKYFRPHRTKICEECGKPFETHRKHLRFCGRSCSTKHAWKNQEYRKIISTKSKSAMDKQVRNGTHKGWKSRKQVGPSFPERFLLTC
jgi:hypothetical protein